MSLLKAYTLNFLFMLAYTQTEFNKGTKSVKMKIRCVIDYCERWILIYQVIVNGVSSQKRPSNFALF